MTSVSDTLLARGERVGLRPLTPADANERYLGWMRDPQVIRHLEARFATHTLESLHAFVTEQAARADTLALAIVELEDLGHIGNIKVGPLDPRHGTADVGLLVGERDWWGKGVATEAIGLAAKAAKAHLDARKLTAGCYGDNVASARAFLANGWQAEGRRVAQYLDDDGNPQDALMFGLVLR